MTYRQYTLERDSLPGEELAYKIRLSKPDGVERVDRHDTPTPFIWSFSEQAYTPEEALKVFKKACVDAHIEEKAIHDRAILAILKIKDIR